MKWQKVSSSFLSYFLNVFEDCLDYYLMFKMHEYNVRRFSSFLLTIKWFYFQKNPKNPKNPPKAGFHTVGFF